MTEKTIRALCTFAYFPFPFIGFAIALVGFKLGSSEIRKHGMNAVLLHVGYLVGAWFVIPMFLSGSFYLFQNILSVDSFVKIVFTTPLWLNAIFTVYQIYLMFRVFQDIHYIPFFSPFRGIV